MFEVKLGCFGNLDDLPAIADAGFRHAELDVQDVMALDSGDFRRFAERLKGTSLICDVFNTMIPVAVRHPVYSGSFDFERWCRFQWTAAEKTSQLGARFWIFANGENRALPVEGDTTWARNRVHYFIRETCSAAAAYGISVLIEPLSSVYTNYLRSLRETAGLIDSLGIPNLAAMADMRHMISEGEDFSEIVRCRQYVKHIHIDNPLSRERRFPTLDDGFPYESFFRILKDAGYCGIVSAEGRYYMQGAARSEFGREAKQARLYLENLIRRC